MSGNLAPSNANVQISGNANNFKQGDVLVVTNCSNADVFKVTNSPGSSGTVTLTHGGGTNTGNRVGTYGKDAFVMRVDQYSYFIGNNPAGNRALYRVGLDAQPEELVEHVQDLQMRYGLDTNANGTVDSYSATPGTWAQVVSVTVNLLMRSPDDRRWIDVDSEVALMPRFRCAVSELILVLMVEAMVNLHKKLTVSGIAASPNARLKLAAKSAGRY